MTNQTLHTALTDFIAPALPFLADRLSISLLQADILAQDAIAIFIIKLQGDTGFFVFDEYDKLDIAHKNTTLAKYNLFNKTIFDYKALPVLPIISLHGFFRDNLNNNSLNNLIKSLSKKYILPAKIINNGLSIILSLCQYYFLYFVYHNNFSKLTYESYINNQQNTETPLSNDILEILTNTIHHRINKNANANYEIHNDNLPILRIGYPPFIIQHTTSSKKNHTPKFIAIGSAICLTIGAIGGYAMLGNSKKDTKTNNETVIIKKEVPVIKDIAVVRTDKETDNKESNRKENNNKQDNQTKNTNKPNQKPLKKSENAKKDNAKRKENTPKKSDNKKLDNKKLENTTTKKPSKSTKETKETKKPTTTKPESKKLEKTLTNKKTEPKKSDAKQLNKKPEPKKVDNKKNNNKKQ